MLTALVPIQHSRGALSGERRSRRARILGPMARKPQLRQDDAPEGLKHNPFAALRPDGKPAPAPAPAPASSAPPEASSDARLVVRREKRGRAGKTVTRVAGLELEEQALSELAREMKRALGCGASTEEGDVLLQGAMTERAAKWLRERLGLPVVVGN